MMCTCTYLPIYYFLYSLGDSLHFSRAAAGDAPDDFERIDFHSIEMGDKQCIVIQASEQNRCYF